jgi:hypothetical protein
VKIKVISEGETVIDADTEHQEPAIRAALTSLSCEEAADDYVASTIIDYTDSERSNISHDQHATVTDDDGTVLWEGWFDGRDEPAPGAVIACLTAALRDIRDANPDAPAGAYAHDRASLALGMIPPGGNRP